jgi:hypothetical protein
MSLFIPDQDSEAGKCWKILTFKGISSGLANYAAGEKVALRSNFHWRAHCNQLVDLVNLLIGDGNAAQRPIIEPVRSATSKPKPAQQPSTAKPI